MGGFELHAPWRTANSWAGEYRIYAAVIAPSEDEAKAVIFACYDNPPKDIDFDFVEEQAEDWCPWDKTDGYVTKIKRQKWMQWPEKN